jgi:ATP adenylyltransferase
MMVVNESASDCIFCSSNNIREVLFENEYSYAVFDKFPVSEGHILIITKRHFDDYFDITQPELEAVNDLLSKGRKSLLDMDPTIQGFNIGINSGEVAGQSILHCHIHLIPRRKGDTEDPRGGVRGVIPGRMNY